MIKKNYNKKYEEKFYENLKKEGYLVFFKTTKYISEMTNEELNVLDSCVYLVNNKSTIRITAWKYGYSSTTFWRRIHYVCKELSPELYKLVCDQLNINKHKGRI